MLRDVFGLFRATRRWEIAEEKWEIGRVPADPKALNTVECSDIHSSITAHKSQDYGLQ